MAQETASITVRDVRIHTFRKGPEGGGERRVLFLHGAGGLPLWLPFFDKLAERCELLVPEHPGFGRSDDPKWIRSVSDLALFYLDFLEAAGLDRVDVIGSSLGGWIAAEIAIRDCSRLRSLTLLAPAGIRIKGVPTGDNFIWSPEEQARNLFHDQAMAERVLNQTLSDEEMDLALKNRFAATKYGWQPRWYNPDLEKWLHRAKPPALILWGDSDKLLPPAYAALWQQRLPDARLKMIERCGHLPHVEKPDAVAADVLAFLEGVRA